MAGLGPGCRQIFPAAMVTFRPILIWLCCALLLFAGAPLRGRAPCALSGDGPECCQEACGCCGAAGAPKCSCADEPAPTPEPFTPAPRPEHATEPEPVRQPAAAPAPRPLLPRPPAAGGLPIGLLPHVSRQKALSVWSC